MKISVKTLQEKGACGMAIAMFKRKFRPGTGSIHMTLENCLKAAGHIDMDCGAVTMFGTDSEAYNVYSRIMETAGRERNAHFARTNNWEDGWKIYAQAQAYAFYAGSLYL